MHKIIFLSLLMFNSCSILTTRSLDFNSYPTLRYQLQEIDNLKFTNSVVIIDYSLHGDESSKHSKDYINDLKMNNNLLLSYMSIGEAETYRYYFKEMPKNLLYKHNKRWEGNIVVRYWREAWQKIIFGSDESYLGQIIEMGFDGVYLDIIDSFENFNNKKKKANQMADFVIKLSKWAKSKKSNFRIVPQNGAHIIEYLEGDIKHQYLKSIDAVAIEGILFSGAKDLNNPPTLENLRPIIFDVYKEYNIPFLSIEYLTDKKLIEQYKNANKYNWLPMCTDRALKGQFFKCDL